MSTSEVQDIISQLRELSAGILLAKTEGTFDSPAVAEQLIQCSVLLSCLKTCSRDVWLTVETSRESVLKENSKADSHHLSLQNLMYERSHILREIATCRDFKMPEMSRLVAEAPDLSPLFSPHLTGEERRGQEGRGEERRGEEGSGGEGRGEDRSHSEALARLGAEKERRGALQAELEARKDALVRLREANSARMKLLDSLPHKLSALLSATAVLQKDLKCDLSDVAAAGSPPIADIEMPAS